MTPFRLSPWSASVLRFFSLISLGLLCPSLSTSSAQDWQKLGPGGGLRIVCSADGTKVVTVDEDPNDACGGTIYLSQDSGKTWDSLPYSGGPDLATSADGSKWICTNPNCGDFFFGLVPAWPTGVTWLRGSFTKASSSVVASSGDGTRLAAGGLWFENILISSNSGASWQTSLTNVPISSLAMSADGLTLAAASPDQAVYISRDFGVTWSTNIVDDKWSGGWNSVACSANGSRIVTASGDGIFISSNGGLDWRRIHDPDSFQSIAASADATQLAAAASFATVYTSTNSGVTWTRFSLADTNAPITTVAISADGEDVFAAASSGSIYRLQVTPPPPILELTAAQTNLTLYWPCPSRGFTLQMTTDPADKFWFDVSASPLLDPTTLQNRLSLPASDQPTFYRLVSYASLQGHFRNLDFDSAILSTNYPGTEVPFVAAFPSWTGYFGTNQAPAAVYQSWALDSASIDILTNSTPTNSTGVWRGKYFAGIQAGIHTSTVTATSLSQEGIIPSSARSLLFGALGGGYVVTLNGQALTVISLGEDLYGADVTSFAGTSAELRFTVLPRPPPGPPINNLWLDSITFSTRPVP